MIDKGGHPPYLVLLMTPNAMGNRVEDLSGVFFLFMTIFNFSASFLRSLLFHLYVVVSQFLLFHYRLTNQCVILAFKVHFSITLVMFY